VLTRFGYAHGWRTAENLRDGLPWDSEDEWKKAGPRRHTLQGLVRAEPAPLEGREGPALIADAIWHDSYEAEQHLFHLGRSEEAVCWTLAGFASGYLSRVHGRDIYCIEERCRGKGDAVCRVVGRAVQDWGDAIAAHLPFYQTACLDAALSQNDRRAEAHRTAAACPASSADARKQASGGRVRSAGEESGDDAGARPGAFEWRRWTRPSS
jgi:two-component system, NtrC family, response regulator HydG